MVAASRTPVAPERYRPRVASPDDPLLVYGPRSLAYDFGPDHPLTPERFGPGIDLLRAVGALPGLAPEPATDGALLRIHLVEYIATVRRLSADPDGPGGMGIGLADNPAFPGMHEAAAAVAGGSLAGMEALMRGDALHVYHPGGGLHHAMASRASGFCIYNDPALAIVRARYEGLRILYVDLDVHHGDGVQALTYDDPGTLTLSFHESGQSLFPGTGAPAELGSGAAAGTSVNMPLEPNAGDDAWLKGVRSLLPSLAAVFGPGLVVSQHGADTHLTDPLAHLRVTTGAMAEAARLVDAVAHRWARGRWLATGGGGYDAYRVVPRAWALTWLAGAHRDPPATTPASWRERWEADAARFGTPGMPIDLIDSPEDDPAAAAAWRTADQRSIATLSRVRQAVLPRLVREAEDRGWWSPSLRWAGRDLVVGAGTGSAGRRYGGGSADPALRPETRRLTSAALGDLALAPRVIAPFDPDDARDLLAAALADGARIVAAVTGSTIVGLAVAAASVVEPSTESLLALGVAPASRRAGLGRKLLRALVAGRRSGVAMEARIGVAERDAVDPAPMEVRMETARRLLAGSGFVLGPVPPDLGRIDAHALAARLGPR
jgi:acetoin utilization protein AcuC